MDRKYGLVKKFTALVLTAILLFSYPAAVLAESADLIPQEGIDESDSILTLDQAVTMALEHNRSMKSNALTIKQLEEIRERSVEVVLANSLSADLGFVADLAAKQTLLNVKQTEIDLDALKRQQKIEETSIAFSVKQHFLEIQEKAMEAEVMGQGLKNERMKARISQLMYQYGMGSLVEAEQKQRESEAAALRQDALQTELEAAISRLAFLVGLQDIGDYTLETLGKGDVDVEPELSDMVLLRLVNNDPYVQLQERQIEKAELGLSLFTYTGREEPYEVRRLSLEKEKNQLAGIRERLHETVTNRYLTLNQMINQRSALALDIQNLRAQETNLSLYFQLGMIREIDLLDLRQSRLQAELSIEKLDHQIILLRELYEKPYLAPEYLQ